MYRTGYLSIYVLFFLACQGTNKETAVIQGYQDIDLKIATKEAPLIAVSTEEYPEYGADIAYINVKGDTLIPFGQYAYFGTDTIWHYANVIPKSAEGELGLPVGVDINGSVLFDIFLFDNGPDYFSEGLTRVKRSGKMGFANEKGEVVIPCIYDFAWPFENGYAKVTYEAEEVLDGDHVEIQSDSWFRVDKNGVKTN